MLKISFQHENFLENKEIFLWFWTRKWNFGSCWTKRPKFYFWSNLHWYQPSICEQSFTLVNYFSRSYESFVVSTLHRLMYIFVNYSCCIQLFHSLVWKQFHHQNEEISKGFFFWRIQSDWTKKRKSLLNTFRETSKTWFLNPYYR